MNVCCVPECEGDPVAHGFCRPHYQRMKRTGSPYPEVFLPFEPLEAAARGGRPQHETGNCRWCVRESHSCYRVGDLADDLGVSERQVPRLRKSGVTVLQADVFAVRLGLVPYQVWDGWFDLPVWVPVGDAV